jgi:hypothetical protein
MVNDGRRSDAPIPSPTVSVTSPPPDGPRPGPPLVLEAVAWSVAAIVLYWVSGPAVTGDMWPPLAEAFLSGQLHLAEDRPWLELVPRPGGGQYVPLPPVPGVVLVPLAILSGPGTPWGEIDGNLYTSVLGGLNVGLTLVLLAGWGVADAPRRWLTLGFATTTHWWVAGMGGPHHFAQVVAVTFLLLALNLAVRGRWPIVAGLCLGLAAGSRLPTGLALPVILGLYGAGWRPSRAWIPVIVGVAVPALAVAGYNVARFGSPFDFGYAHIPSGEDGLVTDEPWFDEGLLSISYIPRHLKVIFLDGFEIVDSAPFLRPSFSGMSLVLTAPFLFWSLLARGRLTWLLWVGVALVMLPNLLHGSWGFAQFGYRFVLDAIPLLILLLGTAFRHRIEWPVIGTIVVGALVHLYGLWAINVLRFAG